MSFNWRGPHTTPSKEISFVDALIETGWQIWFFIRSMVVLSLIGAIAVGLASLFVG